MSLTIASGPLAPSPPPGNYTIDGPKHRIAFTDFPRRLRAEVGGETVLDTTAAKLLHETAIRARLYVPLADVRADVLSGSETTSHCPFKGDATYRTVTVGDRVSADALWTYEEPIESAPWLLGYAGVYEDRFDRWLDEDEEIPGPVRDPYHRVDVRRSSRHLRVTGADGGLLADTQQPLVVSETGIKNRFYIPRADVSAELEPSAKAQTLCPYKGFATHWSAPGAPDVAWSYDEPLDGVTPLAGHLCFEGDAVAIAEVA